MKYKIGKISEIIKKKIKLNFRKKIERDKKGKEERKWSFGFI